MFSGYVIVMSIVSPDEGTLTVQEMNPCGKFTLIGLFTVDKVLSKTPASAVRSTLELSVIVPVVGLVDDSKDPSFRLAVTVAESWSSSEGSSLSGVESWSLCF